MPANKLRTSWAWIEHSLFLSSPRCKGLFAVLLRHQPRPLTLLLPLRSYLIGQGIGGLVFPSYSESFGRRWLYIYSGILFAAFCGLIGAVPSVAGVIIGRFMTGVLSSVGCIVAAGSIEDMWDSRARVWLIFAWGTTANLGMIVGPIMSAYIIPALGWRWVFYISAIVCAGSSIFLLPLRESRPSLILRRTVDKIRKQTGDTNLKTSSPDDIPDLRTFVRTSVFRPVHLFFTEIIVFTVSFLSAVAFALIYLFTEVVPPIFASYTNPPLTQTQQIIPWIALGAGLLLGALTRAWDHRRLRNHKIADIAPEDKLIGFALGAPALAVGLWWFAWTVPPTGASVPWGVPAASLVLVGWALNEFDVVLAGYMADTYRAYAASGFGAMALLRSALSAAFPLFAPHMYQAMGYNHAGTVLAVMATVFCFVPPVFMRYGAAIRRRSKFAMWTLGFWEEDGVTSAVSTEEESEAPVAGWDVKCTV